MQKNEYFFTFNKHAPACDQNSSQCDLDERVEYVRLRRIDAHCAQSDRRNASILKLHPAAVKFDSFRPRPHVSGYFFNPQLFLSGYGFRPHVSVESGIRIRHNEPHRLSNQNNLGLKVSDLSWIPSN